MADLANEVPIVRFVNLVLFQAVQDRASDIHFEPFEDEFKIRYRVDGALYEMTPPPKHLALPVISRLKVMANLNISERRLPQDGRISFQMGEPAGGSSVSTLPTQFGESLVLRVLDRSAVNLELESLGLAEICVRLHRRGDSAAERNFHRHWADRFGQNDYALLLSKKGECNRCEAADRGRPGRV
jgi:type IV pilus assembly protein PilB